MKFIVGLSLKDGDVVLENSLNSQATNLRNNLLENLKEKFEKNFTYVDDVRFFEIGKIFKNINKEVVEYYSFAGVWGNKKIKEKEMESYFLKTKGLIESILETVAVENIEWRESTDKNFVSSIYLEDTLLGNVGVSNWEINLEKLITLKKDKNINYVAPSKYPSILRDVAFFVPEDKKMSECQKIIESNIEESLEEISLFDIYHDKENKKKSFGFRIVFRSFEKTLSDADVNSKMDKVYKALEKEGFEIR